MAMSVFSDFSGIVLSPALLLFLAAQPRQEPKGTDGLAQLLAKRDYQALAKAMVKGGSKSLAALGKDGAALIGLRRPALRAVLAGLAKEHAGQAQGPIEKQLRAVLLSQRGDPIPAYRIFVDFLDRAELRLAVLPHVSRGAMQLCRSGEQEGLPVLTKIAGLYKGQAWAISNLANALRYLARYGEAIKLYEGLLRADGRNAWTLNGLGLCHQAQGLLDKALALYLEGTATGTAGQEGDKNSCRSNAAWLLWQGGGRENRVRAARLLAAVKDPLATRARYWRVQIEREGLRQSSWR